jgi:hypothetical protein
MDAMKKSFIDCLDCVGEIHGCHEEDPFVSRVHDLWELQVWSKVYVCSWTA